VIGPRCPWSLIEVPEPDRWPATCGHCGRYVDVIECTGGGWVIEEHAEVPDAA